jgi:hypothetical protein
VTTTQQRRYRVAVTTPDGGKRHPYLSEIVTVDDLATLLDSDAAAIRMAMSRHAAWLPAPAGQIGKNHVWIRSELDIEAIRAARPPQSGKRRTKAADAADEAAAPTMAAPDDGPTAGSTPLDEAPLPRETESSTTIVKPVPAPTAPEHDAVEGEPKASVKAADEEADGGQAAPASAPDKYVAALPAADTRDWWEPTDTAQTPPADSLAAPSPDAEEGGWWTDDDQPHGDQPDGGDQR